jgi:hypothetical protein
MLAEVADLHCLLEIRAGGNLEAILKEERARVAKARWVIERPSRGKPNAPTPHKEGPSLEDPPGWTKYIVIPARHVSNEGEAAPGWSEAPRSMSLCEVDRSRFLWHYTRACAGPWPGQTHEDYLWELLEDAPHSGHSAFDTLMRILLEGRIRASAKLLRGSAPAVSFTSIAPPELNRLKHWNAALGRWTVEPYGIGIDRGLLKRVGAKPVVYGPPWFHDKLTVSDRFRFQKHQPPRTLWKHEREWRLPRDLFLSDVPPDKRLVYLPTSAEAHRIAREVGPDWLVVALEEPGTWA